MEDSAIYALSLQFSSLLVTNRREMIDLVKVGVGGCDWIYRKVTGGNAFNCLSVFSVPLDKAETFLEGVTQIEFYSERAGLELLCAGKLESCRFAPCAVAAAAPHRPALGKRMFSPVSVSEQLTIPLYFNTKGIFSIHAGQVLLVVQVFRVLPDLTPTGICSNCIPATSPSMEVVIPRQLPVPEQPGSDAGTDDDSYSSTGSIEQCESDGTDSVDDFVQTFFTHRLPSSSRQEEQEQVLEQDTQEQLEVSRQPLPQQQSYRRRTVLGFHQSRRKSEQPHYMQPARTAAFPETLRKR